MIHNCLVASVCMMRDLIDCGLLISASAALPACLAVCRLLVLAPWGTFYLQWVQYLFYVQTIRG